MRNLTMGKFGAAASFLILIALISLNSATAAPSLSAPLVDEGVSALRLPSPEIETLPNGLRVAWFLDPKLPIVDMGLLFMNGTRSDPAGKSGLALLTGQTLERGAGGKNALDFSRAFERLGGSFGVNTDEDGTSISIHGLSRDAEAYFDLLADVTLRPNFDPAELKQVQGAGDRSLESPRGFGRGTGELRFRALDVGRLSVCPGKSREYPRVEKADGRGCGKVTT